MNSTHKVINRCDEMRVEPEGKAFNLLVSLGSTLSSGHDRKNKVRMQAAGMGFLHTMSDVILRDRVRGSVIWEKPLVPSIERSQ